MFLNIGKINKNEIKLKLNTNLFFEIFQIVLIVLILKLTKLTKLTKHLIWINIYIRL